MIYLQTPRDSFQGFKSIIPTDLKIKYYQLLLEVGFDIIDIGSFVSHKAVPQMSDTSLVISNLDFTGTDTKILAIIGNVRGANELINHKEILYAGYPASVSAEFLKRNLNSTQEKSFEKILDIKKILDINYKELVIYVSMSFGNPYNEKWNSKITIEYIKQLIELGITKIILADTTGIARKEDILNIFNLLINLYPTIDFGLHLHVGKDEPVQKITNAFVSGVRWFDSSIFGLGGCPFVEYKHVGNLSTEKLIGVLGKNKLDMDKFYEAKELLETKILKYK